MMIIIMMIMIIYGTRTGNNWDMFNMFQPCWRRIERVYQCSPFSGWEILDLRDPTVSSQHTEKPHEVLRPSPRLWGMCENEPYTRYHPIFIVTLIGNIM